MWSPFTELAPGGEDEAHGADPGKDLFALLALTFLVISVLFMVASRTADTSLPVDSAGPSRAEQPAEPPPPAAMRSGEQGIEVVQEGRRWTLPAEAATLASEAALLETPGELPILIVDLPGAELRADQLVLAVQVLNGAGVRVSFRAVAAPGGATQ